MGCHIRRASESGQRLLVQGQDASSSGAAPGLSLRQLTYESAYELVWSGEGGHPRTAILRPVIRLPSASVGYTPVAPVSGCLAPPQIDAGIVGSVNVTYP
ncbi:hypothetical protein J6590_061856 [Homalodisca vitripennis]|nr:hypothetical protein J6590_061856 [Homalodisca vitripennis]